MSTDDLRNRIHALRNALSVVEMEYADGEAPTEGLLDLSTAVDNVRKSVWAILTAEHAEDYNAFLAKIRVRRATETCQDVLSDLYADTLTPNTPGLEVFQATLKELSDASKAAKG